ncbi:MAG: 30S ribosomal protein S2 [Aggregatilineales bacterium]
MPSTVKMRELLETGVHFGHRTTRWNPKMDEFIFTARNGIHIINLQITLRNMNAYYDEIANVISRGGTVLFVGTKRQAQETIQQEAERCGMPYVTQRWLGGTLTNWKTISSSIDTLKKLERDQQAGKFDRLTKKEALMNERKIQKLRTRLGGLRNMKKLPALLVVVDTDREATAVKEANILGIPVLGIVDTNGNPDVVDYIIPANDDAMRSIRLLVHTFSSAVMEGKNRRGIDEADEAASGGKRGYIDNKIADADDGDLLGTSTLENMKKQNELLLDDDGDESSE